MPRRRKQESSLGLPPVPKFDQNAALAAPGVGLGLRRPLTRNEEATVDEWHHQQLVILGQEKKTEFGLSKMGEIHQHGRATFARTLDANRVSTNSHRDEECQSRIDEFTQHQEALLAQCLSVAIETGCTNILIEVGRSLYVEVREEQQPEPQQTSVWKLLFG